MNKEGVIYTIYNNQSGRYYVGQTDDFRDRIRRHKGDLKRGVHRNGHLQNAWNKYSSEAFEFTKLLRCSTRDKTWIEQVYLDAYFDTGILYNIASRADTPKRKGPDTCTIDGCDKPYKAGGYCNTHYERVRRNGTLETQWTKECTIVGCDRKHYGKGYCLMHYKRMKKTGSVGPVEPIYQHYHQDTCTIDSCDRPYKAKGCCEFHYNRLGRITA